MTEPTLPGTRRGRRIAQAILATYSFRLITAWLLALPIVHTIGASGISRFPEGDKKLFESGGLYLLEVLQREQTTLAAHVASAAWLLVLFSFAGLGFDWLQLRALRPTPPSETLGSEAARVLPRLALLGALTWLVRAVLLVVTLTLAMTVRSYFVNAEDERIPDLIFVAVAALGLLAQVGISVLRDVTSASLVERDIGRSQAYVRGFGVLKRHALSLFTRYAVVGGATLAVVTGCAATVGYLDVSRAGAWRTGLSVALHQTAVLLTILLRTYWLSQARHGVELAQR
jgi:hypothetical protein